MARVKSSGDKASMAKRYPKAIMPVPKIKKNKKKLKSSKDVNAQRTSTGNTVPRTQCMPSKKETIQEDAQVKDFTKKI